MSKITYTNKVDLTTSSVAAINKVVAADMNEIKTVVNDNDDLIGDLTNLETTEKGSIVGAINNVVDSGTGYVKYCDGTMICYGSKTGTTTETHDWSQGLKLSESIVFDNFAQTFIAAPIVSYSANFASAGHVCMTSPSYDNHPVSTTSPGGVQIIMPDNASGVPYNFNYIAIGKWK